MEAIVIVFSKLKEMLGVEFGVLNVMDVEQWTLSQGLINGIDNQKRIQNKQIWNIYCAAAGFNPVYGNKIYQGV